MPLYEYQCKICGEEFEKVVRWFEVDIAPECPKCKSRETQKKISNVSSLGGSDDSSYTSSCGSTGGFR